MNALFNESIKSFRSGCRVSRISQISQISMSNSAFVAALHYMSMKFFCRIFTFLSFHTKNGNVFHTKNFFLSSALSRTAKFSARLLRNRIFSFSPKKNVQCTGKMTLISICLTCEKVSFLLFVFCLLHRHTLARCVRYFRQLSA